MAKQIIVTQNDYGIELETQFVDDKKKPLDITDYDVWVKVIYDDKTINTILAEHKDSANGIACIVLEKEHLINAGLHTVVWSVVDEDEHVTAQEDLYYFVKETKVSSDNNDSDNNDNEDIIEDDKIAIILDKLNEVTEARKDNITGTEHDTIGKRMDNISEKLNNSQLFKLTKDNGEYNYNIESEKKSVLDLDVGNYGSSSSYFTDLPIGISSYIQIEVTKNTYPINNS